MTGEASTDPIFITGLDRSGKTRLRLLLNGLPDIHIARRSALLSSLDGAYGDLRAAGDLEALADAIGRRPGLRDAIPPLEELRAMTTSSVDAYAAIFRAVLARHALQHGASRWGEQDTDLMWRTGRLVAAYPSVRVVHVLRDPRARHAAVRHDRPRTIGLVGATTAAWVASARIALADRSRDSERHGIVRSEDLPEDAQPAFAAELALRRERAMLTAQLPPGEGWTDAEARFIERHAAPEMRALGYRPSPRTVSGWRAVRDRIAHGPPAGVRYHARRFADRRRAGARGLAT